MMSEMCETMMENQQMMDMMEMKHGQNMDMENMKGMK